MTDIKCYSELILIPDFKDKYEYLKLDGYVGNETFGFDRYLNQVFYRSLEWRRIRNEVIIRDNGCDLGHQDYPINGRVIIHHLNPLTIDDIRKESKYLLDPEYLICVSHQTHNAIHYGDDSKLFTGLTQRNIGDTKLW